MGPGELHDVLTDLRRNGHPDLLVGLARRDDAAVYRIGDEVAIVETVDFFPPAPRPGGGVPRRSCRVVVVLLLECAPGPPSPPPRPPGRPLWVRGPPTTG